MQQDTERGALVEAIVHRLARRHTTAMVLFHHAVAERLRLGPSDHKCLDLLREHDAMTASELAGMTGLTTGAVTGVVARLERAGYLRRQPDPDDRRKQILRAVPEHLDEIQDVIEPLRSESRELLEHFDDDQLATIAEFLTATAEIGYRHAARMRAEAVASPLDSAPGFPKGKM